MAHFDRDFSARESLSEEGGPDIRERVSAAKDQFMRWVRVENHGIRERNVLKLLLPAGIREHEIETAWLATVAGPLVTNPRISPRPSPTRNRSWTPSRRLSKGLRQLIGGSLNYRRSRSPIV